MIGADYEEDFAHEIPPKLYDAVDELRGSIAKILVHVKVSGRWKTLPKQMTFGRGADQTTGEICKDVVQRVIDDHDRRGRDSSYRAQIHYTDEDKRIRRKTVTLKSHEDGDGVVGAVDAEEFTERTQITMLVGMLDKTAKIMDDREKRYLEMMDKQILLTNAMGDQAMKNAQGLAQVTEQIAAMGSGMAEAFQMVSTVTTAANEKSIPVQLAELDIKAREGKTDTAAEAFDLLKKFGPVLMAKLMSLGPTAQAKSSDGATVTQESPPPESTSAAPKDAENKDDGPPKQLEGEIVADTPAEKAKALQAWIDSLDPGTEKDLRAVIGDESFDRFADAAKSKDDARVEEVFAEYREEFEELGRTEPTKQDELIADLGVILSVEQIGTFLGLLIPD